MVAEIFLFKVFEEIQNVYHMIDTFLIFDKIWSRISLQPIDQIWWIFFYLNCIDIYKSNKKIFIKFDQVVAEISLIKVLSTNLNVSVMWYAFWNSLKLWSKISLQPPDQIRWKFFIWILWIHRIQIKNFHRIWSGGCRDIFDQSFREFQNAYHMTDTFKFVDKTLIKDISATTWSNLMKIFLFDLYISIQFK